MKIVNAPSWEVRSGRSMKWSFSRIMLLALVMIMPLVVSGCKQDPRLQFIQGGWYYKDAHLANIPAESAQTTNWVFDNGYFSMDTCCFTEAYFSGKYYV